MNPLSAVFGAGVAFRNVLYQRQLLPIGKLSRPVVSIGNLSVGGSGKTPLLIALGRLLKNRGIEFDVLSRGYGRRARGVAVVAPQGSAEEFGDEPLLIARELQIPVVVGTDRYEAGRLAEEMFSSQLHLLDDGFQHRRLHRDFDILIVRAEDLQDTLLPLGRLREPVYSSSRADAVVTLDPITLTAGRLWAGQRRMTAPAIGGKVIAFCGIARPSQFFDELQEQGVTVVNTVSFPDHHRYRERDIGRLLRLKSGGGADGFLTTEKDLINLGELSERLQPLEVARLDILLRQPKAVLDALLSALESRCGRFTPPA